MRRRWSKTPAIAPSIIQMPTAPTTDPATPSTRAIITVAIMAAHSPEPSPRLSFSHIATGIAITSEPRGRRSLPKAGFHSCASCASLDPISIPLFRKRDRRVSKAPTSVSKNSGRIYIGVGGWTFAPWRGVFYPEKLVQSKELQYAASKLTSIEINGTYYGSQKPESFRKWAREVPDGFVFSLKGPRFATNRRVLAEAGDSIKYFYNTGVLELGDRLGPVLWQFAPTKK